MTRLPNRSAFPSFDLALGPHDPSKLQHRHPFTDWVKPVPETIPPMDEPQQSEWIRLNDSVVRRANTGEQK